MSFHEMDDMKYDDILDDGQKKRSLNEIRDYLRTYVPSLSVQEGIIIFIVTPTTTIINILYIFYYFIYYVLLKRFKHDDAMEYKTLKVFISSLEAGVLIILIIVSMISYQYKYYSLFIKCLNYCGTWSTFQLFSTFRPKALINLYAIIFTQHSNRIRDTESRKGLLLKSVESQLINDDAKIINDADMKQVLKQLKAAVNKREVSKLVREKRTGIYNDERKVFGYRARQRASWILIIILSVMCLCIGFLSFVMKIYQLRFIESPMDVKPQDWLLLIGFGNQLWNLSDNETIKINTVYELFYMDSSAKRTRYVSKRIVELDSLIKSKLIDSFGFRGILIALGMTSTVGIYIFNIVSIFKIRKKYIIN